MNQPNYPWAFLQAVRHTPLPVPKAQQCGLDRWWRRFNLFNVVFFGLLFVAVAFMLAGQ